MSFPSFTRTVAAAASAAVLALCASPVLADTYTGLYVFGDSLSDDHNLFALSSQTVPDPVLYPSNGRFSNGPVAVEYLATNLGLNNPAQFHDMAIAGAETGMGGSAGFGTGMQAQVAGYTNFLSSHSLSAESTALYVVWGGANDLLHAPFSDLMNPSTRAALIGGTITNLVTEVQTLYGAGARSFLLPLLPDLGKTPRVLGLDASLSAGGTVAAGISGIAYSFNQALLGAYWQLSAALPDEKFHYFDTFTATDVAAATFANATTPCIGTADSPTCTGYMFFDDIHPTTATHQVLGNLMAASVPEPASMLLMALGVVGVFGWSRRAKG